MMTPGISSAEFAVAVGICTGMTALPILGAVLREMELLGSRIGQLALGIDGIDDAVLWVLLSVLLTSRAGQVAGGHVGLATLLLVPLYLVFMIRAVWRLLGSMVVAPMQDEMIDERALTVVGNVNIASALATETLGLHYIIGAFVTGAVMPVNLRKPILDRLQVLTVVLLMPFFFACKSLAFRRPGCDPAGMQDYRRGGRTIWDCKYHLVWVTKYRYPILVGDVGQRTRELWREIARSNEMTIYVGAINRDHVHMPISIPPQLSVSRAVQLL